MYLIFNRKSLVAAGVAVVLAAAVLIAGTGIYEQNAIPTAAEVNWGLSFPEEGKSPVGNASAEQLKQWGAYYIGDTSVKQIYLTFDAGYENGQTERILNVLKKHHAPAAFFLVGNYISSSPELVKRMVQEGHTVGNHTFHHPDMSKISDEVSFSNELTSLEQLFEETTGEKMKKFYRPPQGKYSENNLKMAQKLGYTTVFWSLAYVDWYNDQQPSEEEALQKLLPRIHNGAVLLLHSTSETNARILDRLLTELEQKGYQFADISTLTSS